MDVKSYLQEVSKSQRKYLTYRDRLIQYESMISFPKAQNFGGKPINSSTANSTESKNILACVYREEYEKAEKEMLEKRVQAQRLIAQLEDVTEQEILTRRYIMLETWEQIAEKLHYSYRHITRLHGIALQKMSLNVLLDM